MRQLVRVSVVAACVGLGASEALAGAAATVALGQWHSCALTTGGGVVCWGENNYGQVGDGTTTPRSSPTAVSGLASGVAAIAAGQNHTCALTTGGGVLCWGNNSYGQVGEPTAVSGLASGVAAIAAGGAHTCALTTGGAVACWGFNGFGQLGDGTTTNRPTPTAVSGLGSGVTAIAAGLDHTCALTAVGAAVCWGLNSLSQLGDGTTTNRATPTAVSGLGSGVTAIAAGAQHACALKAGGGAMCWGYNIGGQLGDGTGIRRKTPTQVSGLTSGVAAIAAGYFHTCALTIGGGVLCWGSNGAGVLGDGTTTGRFTPTAVSGLSSGVAALAAGDDHNCAVTTDGSIVCWGWNSHAQLGDGTATNRPTPTAVSGLASGVAAIAASGDHTCALTTGGGVLCWGNNTYGGLGDGTGATRPTPTAVIGLASGVAAIAAGVDHTCALTTGGGVLCWGENNDGQVGDGTTTNRSAPVVVSGLGSGVTAVTARGYHTCAVTAAGGAVCWGQNNYGQVGDGTTTNRPTPTAVSGLGSGVAAVTVGVYHTCALTTGGAVLCWGFNAYGGLGDGTTTDRSTPTAVSGLGSGVAAIMAGFSYTCALTTGGGVLCWGVNSVGQLGDGTRANRLTPTAVKGLGSGVAAISAFFHTCAVKTNGSVLCWGFNSVGQLGDGTRTDRSTPVAVSGLGSGVAAIAAGDSHTCALANGGGLLCWGGDEFGQLGLGTRTFVTLPLGVYGFGGAISASSISPATGPSAGGTSVTITGAYFLQGATVTIGGVSATSVTVVNTETITATTGARAAGNTDVVVHNPDGTQATLAGAFTYAAAGGSAGRGDFTGDLKSDILWRHATQGDVWLWPMDGAARTAETFVRTVGDTDWEIRGLGDQTGDGKADILWRNKTTGMIYFWPMNGSTPLAETYVATVDPAYDIVGTGDYDGDGKSDILWRHLTNGEVWIWLMGATPPVRIQVWEPVDPAYVIKGSGDVDGDGKSDIVWHHATTGEVWVWLMNGTTRTSETHVGTVPDVGYQIVGVADHTGDGKADILWHHATRGEVWMWPMDGTTRLSETWVGTVPDTGYQIVGSGDYNGDGKADILWHHATRGEVWVWLMDGTTKVSETWVATVPDVGYQIVKGK